MLQTTDERPKGATQTIKQEPAHCEYARQAARLSMAEAARALSISPQLLNDIEKGRRSAKADLLDRMASLYGCPRTVLARRITWQVAA